MNIFANDQKHVNKNVSTALKCPSFSYGLECCLVMLKTQMYLIISNSFDMFIFLVQENFSSIVTVILIAKSELLQALYYELVKT